MTGADLERGGRGGRGGRRRWRSGAGGGPAPGPGEEVDPDAPGDVGVVSADAGLCSVTTSLGERTVSRDVARELTSAATAAQREGTAEVGLAQRHLDHVHTAVQGPRRVVSPEELAERAARGPVCPTPSASPAAGPG